MNHNDRPVFSGQRMVVEIDGQGDGPDGIAHVGDYVIFVAGVWIGERVEIELTKATRKYGRGRIVDLVRRSPHRVRPPCPVFERCGGCTWQFVDEVARGQRLRERVAAPLSYALGQPADRLPIRAAAMPPTPRHQRTKVALMLEAAPPPLYVRYGLYERGSQRVVPVETCLVADPSAEAAACAIAETIRAERLPIFDPRGSLDGYRAVVARAAPGTGERHVVVVASSAEVPGRAALVKRAESLGLTGLSLDVNDHPSALLNGQQSEVWMGMSRQRQVIGGVTYLSSPGGFFQTSAWGASHLVEVVRESVPRIEQGVLLDLYCGAGLLTLALADRAPTVVGLEGNPAAIADAEASAKVNQLDHVVFEIGAVERVLPAWAARGRLQNVKAVVLDPPRGGCLPDVLPVLIGAPSIRTVVYVSCDPVAFARDARVLVDGGFGLVDVRPFDMFPMTSHVEVVGVFQRA